MKHSKKAFIDMIEGVKTNVSVLGMATHGSKRGKPWNDEEN